MANTEKITPNYRVADIRNAILWNREQAAIDYRTDDYGHPVDRLRADYLSRQPKWEKEVRSYLKRLHKRGERVVYADICGRASGDCLGADISYCFSLHASNLRRRFCRPGEVLVDGDLFRMRDFNSFLAQMKRNGDAPALVTFNPLAGLQSYTPTKEKLAIKLHPQVTWQRLENNLRRLLETVRPGGYLYLDRPFQLAGTDTFDWLSRKELCEYQSVKWMTAFCRDRRCRIRFDRTITGVKFLLKKDE